MDIDYSLLDLLDKKVEFYGVLNDNSFRLNDQVYKVYKEPRPAIGPVAYLLEKFTEKPVDSNFKWEVGTLGLYLIVESLIECQPLIRISVKGDLEVVEPDYKKPEIKPPTIWLQFTDRVF